MIDINYGTVSAAAESIEKNGEEPSVRSIRRHMGGGSYTELTPLVRQWKAARTERSASSIKLNPAIGDLILFQIGETAALASNDANLRAQEAEDAFDEQAKQVTEIRAKLNTSNA